MTSLVQDVGVDHGRRDIPLAEEFLDASDIAKVLPDTIYGVNSLVLLGHGPQLWADLR
jgi:hypothetical protein